MRHAMLEKLATDKHSSLLDRYVSYKEKEFVVNATQLILPQVKLVKLSAG